MNKNAIILVFLVIFLGFPLHAREREEMIVLFDTSVSVLPIYDDLVSLVVQGIAENQLKGGDTFHLLSFDDTPVYEFTRTIQSSEDLVYIGRYMEVLKPMGLHTDLIQALTFLFNFTRDLSINSRKTILILTDGIHNPAPGSVHYGRADDYVRRSLAAITDRINRQGWNVRILDTTVNDFASLDSDTSLMTESSDSAGRSDFSESSDSRKPAGEDTAGRYEDTVSDREGSVPVKSGENLLSQLSQELKAPITTFSGDNKDLAIQVMGIVGLSYEESLGEVRSNFNLQLEITNYGNLPVLPTLTGIIWDGKNILKNVQTSEIKPGVTKRIKTEIHLPADTAPGVYDIPVTFQFSEGVKVSPQTGFLSFTLTGPGGKGLDTTALYAILVLFGFLIIITTAVLIRRHLEKTADEETYRQQTSRLTEEIAIAEALEGTQTGHPGMSDGSFAPGVLTQAVSGSSSSSRPPRGKGHAAEGTGKADMSKVPLQEVKTAHTIHQSKEVPKAKGMVSIPPQDRQYAVEMKVEEQNPFIGIRNIRAVKEAPLGVGGKGSPFHIFIRPFPDRVAEISRRDGHYVLTPLKAEYFPTLKGPLVNCLNQWIPLKDAGGREVKILFQHWVSPVERINRLMHSIDRPGLFKEDF